MAYRYKAIAKEKGYVKANQFLLHISEHLKLGKTGLHADYSDDEFTHYAEIQSKKLQLDIHDFTFKMGQKSAIVKASSDVEKAGPEFPLKIKPDDSPETIKHKIDAASARVSNA